MVVGDYFYKNRHKVKNNLFSAILIRLQVIAQEISPVWLQGRRKLQGQVEKRRHRTNYKSSYE